MSDDDPAAGKFQPTGAGPAGVVVARQKDGFGALFGAKRLELLQHGLGTLAKWRREFLPGVAIENHRPRPGDERAQGGNVLDPRDLVAEMQVGQDADRLDHGVGRRWRTASKTQTPVATETFKHSTFPAIGMDARKSQFSSVRRRMPLSSAPMTRASGPFRSRS